jgi:hypothetical protein
MPEFRGRALIYPTLLLAGWVAGRVAYLSWDDWDQLETRLAVTAAELDVQPRLQGIAVEPGSMVLPTLLKETGKRGPISLYQANCPSLVQRPTTPLTAIQALVPPRTTRFPEANSLSSVAQRTALSGTTEKLEPTANDQRWFGYAYSFWRISGNSSNVVAPAGQYGGSQAGLILGYDLGEKRDEGLALLLRGATAPDRGGEEFAVGLRWQRPAKLPLSITAERRIVIDGRDKWAVYAAGGVDPRPLPLKFKLDAYAQSGWVSGRDGGAFFDAQARAMRQVANIGDTAIKAGAGAWAGGQEGLRRVDIGPAMAVEIPVDETRLDLRLDWRQRIAGNARPGNGLALTVSAGF